MDSTCEGHAFEGRVRIDQWRTCGLCGLLCLRSRPDLLAHHLRDLSSGGSRRCNECCHCRQLGHEPGGRRNLSDTGQGFGSLFKRFCCKVSSPSAPGSSSISWSRKPRVRLLNRLKSTGERESRNRHRWPSTYLCKGITGRAS